MSAWEQARQDLLRQATPGPALVTDALTLAQQKLAEYVQGYAGVASLFLTLPQSALPGFDALRTPLIEHYRRIFTPMAFPVAGADAAKAGAAWLRYQQAAERCARQATAIATDACERFGASLAATGPGAPPITSLRALHAVWIECGEAAYLAAARREEFAAAQAELLAALVELRAGTAGK